MGEQPQRNLRNYWTEAPPRALRDAWHLFRPHVFWDLLLLFTSLFGLALRDILSKDHPVFSYLWRDLFHGALLMGGVCVFAYLCQLLFVTPARLRRDALAEAEAAKSENARLQADLESQKSENARLQADLESLQRAHATEIADLKARTEELEAQLAAEAAFTSDGLAWETLPTTPVAGSNFNGFATIVNISPHEVGGQLPQPLTLRVQCSQEPKMAFPMFYENSRDMTPPSGKYYDRDCPVDIKGKCVYIELRQPRLKPPAMLSVNLYGESKEAVTIELIERQVSVSSLRLSLLSAAQPGAGPP